MANIALVDKPTNHTIPTNGRKDPNAINDVRQDNTNSLCGSRSEADPPPFVWVPFWAGYTARSLGLPIILTCVIGPFGLAIFESLLWPKIYESAPGSEELLSRFEDLVHNWPAMYKGVRQTACKVGTKGLSVAQRIHTTLAAELHEVRQVLLDFDKDFQATEITDAEGLKLTRQLWDTLRHQPPILSFDALLLFGTPVLMFASLGQFLGIWTHPLPLLLLAWHIVQNTAIWATVVFVGACSYVKWQKFIREENSRQIAANGIPQPGKSRDRVHDQGSEANSPVNDGSHTSTCHCCEDLRNRFYCVDCEEQIDNCECPDLSTEPDNQHDDTRANEADSSSDIEGNTGLQNGRLAARDAVGRQCTTIFKTPDCLGKSPESCIAPWDPAFDASPDAFYVPRYEPVDEQEEVRKIVPGPICDQCSPFLTPDYYDNLPEPCIDPWDPDFDVSPDPFFVPRDPSTDYLRNEHRYLLVGGDRAPTGQNRVSCSDQHCLGCTTFDQHQHHDLQGRCLMANRYKIGPGCIPFVEPRDDPDIKDEELIRMRTDYLKNTTRLYHTETDTVGSSIDVEAPVPAQKEEFTEQMEAVERSQQQWASQIDEANAVLKQWHALVAEYEKGLEKSRSQQAAYDLIMFPHIHARTSNVKAKNVDCGSEERHGNHEGKPNCQTDGHHEDDNEDGYDESEEDDDESEENDDDDDQEPLSRSECALLDGNDCFNVPSDYDQVDLPRPLDSYHSDHSSPYACPPASLSVWPNVETSAEQRAAPTEDSSRFLLRQSACSAVSAPPGIPQPSDVQRHQDAYLFGQPRSARCVRTVVPPNLIPDQVARGMRRTPLQDEGHQPSVSGSATHLTGQLSAGPSLPTNVFSLAEVRPKSNELRVMNLDAKLPTDLFQECKRVWCTEICGRHTVLQCPCKESTGLSVSVHQFEPLVPTNSVEGGDHHDAGDDETFEELIMPPAPVVEGSVPEEILVLEGIDPESLKPDSNTINSILSDYGSLPSPALSISSAGSLSSLEEDDWELARALGERD